MKFKSSEGRSGRDGIQARKHSTTAGGFELGTLRNNDDILGLVRLALAESYKSQGETGRAALELQIYSQSHALPVGSVRHICNCVLQQAFAYGWAARIERQRAAVRGSRPDSECIPQV